MTSLACYVGHPYLCLLGSWDNVHNQTNGSLALREFFSSHEDVRRRLNACKFLWMYLCPILDILFWLHVEVYRFLWTIVSCCNKSCVDIYVCACVLYRASRYWVRMQSVSPCCLNVLTLTLWFLGVSTVTFVYTSSSSQLLFGLELHSPINIYFSLTSSSPQMSWSAHERNLPKRPWSENDLSWISPQRSCVYMFWPVFAGSGYVLQKNGSQKLRDFIVRLL